MTFIPGSQSGIQKGRRGTVARSSRRDFAAHWDGGPTPTTPAGELSLLKGYERYHNSKGWGGLGYNLAAGPVTGKVYEARGLDRVGAHTQASTNCGGFSHAQNIGGRNGSQAR